MGHFFDNDDGDGEYIIGAELLSLMTTMALMKMTMSTMMVTSPKSSGAHLPFVFDALGLDRSQCSLQSSAQMRMNYYDDYLKKQTKSESIVKI